jgi:hypothetical protein
MDEEREKLKKKPVLLKNGGGIICPACRRGTREYNSYNKGYWCKFGCGSKWWRTEGFHGSPSKKLTNEVGNESNYRKP